MGFIGDMLKARFMPGIQAAAMKPFAAQAQGLLGAAPGQYQMGAEELFPGEAPIQGLQTAGSGLLADPTNIGNQMKFGLGMASLPGYGGFGADVMRQGLLQQLGLPMAQEQMGIDQAKLGLDQWKANRGTSAMQNMQAAGLERGTPAYQAAMHDYLMKPSTVVENNMGGVPSGAVREDGPSGPRIRYLPGSKEAVAAQSEVSNLDRSLESIDMLVDQIEQHGSEAFGPNSKRMGVLYSELQATMADMYNKGVLQEAELEDLKRVLPNPTDWGSSFTGNESMMASYQAAADALERKRRDKLRDYSGMGVKGGYQRKQRGQGVQAQPAPPPPAGFRER